MTRISTTRKVDLVVDALTTYGPLDIDTLREATGLSYGQFRSAWTALKREWAPANDVVAVYDFWTGTYGLWNDDEEGLRGTLNRLDDACTRLLTIERGSLDAMAAQGIITRRLHRALANARDEYEDMAGRYGRLPDVRASVDG